MRPIVLALIILGIAFASGGVTRPAAADQLPYVSVTNCEQLQVNGQSAVRLTLSFFAKSPGGWGGMAVLPPAGPNYPDTCSVIEGTAPPGWTVYRQADGNLYFYAPAYLPTNSVVGGFQITINKGACCKYFGFIQTVLLDNPSTQVCFVDCLAVPTEQPSWGHLKAIYR